MAEELATVSTPALPKTGQIGFKEAMGMQEPFIKRKSELQQGITAAEGDIAKATQAQSEVRQSGKMQAQQEFGAAQEGAMQGLQQKLEAEPLPAFIPTKDTAQDLAGLFSIVSVIGMIAGKQNGQLAMSAMNGMLDGYQKGRADLYKKEAAEFDKNFKSMLSKHAEFRKEMEDAIKLASTNKEAGLQAAELAATKAGSSIVQAQLRKGDLVGAFNLVKESAQGAEKALTLEANVRQKAADRAAADERARLQRQQQIDLANIKAGGGDGKALKEKELSKIGGMDSISNSLEKLKNDFKPEYASLGLLGFGADLSLEAKRRLGDKKGQEAVSWWSRYQQLQAPNRHALFGATLTGNELKNYQSFTTKPGDAASTVRNFLTDQINYTKDTADVTRRSFESAGFKVPKAEPVDFESTYRGGSSAPAQNIQQDAVSRFGAYEPEKYDYGYEDGKFYRDKK